MYLRFQKCLFATRGFPTLFKYEIKHWFLPTWADSEHSPPSFPPTPSSPGSAVGRQTWGLPWRRGSRAQPAPRTPPFCRWRLSARPCPVRPYRGSPTCSARGSPRPGSVSVPPSPGIKTLTINTPHISCDIMTHTSHVIHASYITHHTYNQTHLYAEEALWFVLSSQISFVCVGCYGHDGGQIWCGESLQVSDQTCGPYWLLTVILCSVYWIIRGEINKWNEPRATQCNCRNVGN